MKLIIAGSRSLNPSVEELNNIVCQHWNPKEIIRVVSGGAIGVDQVGEKWAKKEGIPYVIFIPGWGLHGRFAAFMRNKDMAYYGDQLLAIWDNKSKGTRHMIEEMEALGKPVVIANVNSC